MSAGGRGRTATRVEFGPGHECSYCGTRVDVDHDGGWVHDHDGERVCPEMLRAKAHLSVVKP